MKYIKKDLKFIEEEKIALDSIMYNDKKFLKFKEWLYETQKSEKIEILNFWSIDKDNIQCTAILYKNNEPVAKISEDYKKEVISQVCGQRKNSPLEVNLLKRGIKSLMLNNFDYYMKLPKISECPKLLQEIYKTVWESDSFNDKNDWKGFNSYNYTSDDIYDLKKEIEKYQLNDLIDFNDSGYKVLESDELKKKFNYDLGLAKNIDESVGFEL